MSETRSRNVERIRRAVFSQPWAIQPRKLEAIIAVLEGASDSDIAAAAENTPKAGGGTELVETVLGVPVVPIIGVIAKRMTMFHRISGGTSLDRIGKAWKEALAMDSEAVILQIDSPGGTVEGVAEFASEVFREANSGKKTVIAFADGMAASAAYWIGSQANEFHVSEAAAAGSIGVIATVYDDTRMMQNAGIDPTIIRSSELKAAGAGPMSDRQWDSVHAEVMAFYGMFKEAVDRGRNSGGMRTDVERVSTGEVWIGAKAVEMGIADRVSTLEEIASRYEKKV